MTSILLMINSQFFSSVIKLHLTQPISPSLYTLFAWLPRQHTLHFSPILLMVLSQSSFLVCLNAGVPGPLFCLYSLP